MIKKPLFVIVVSLLLLSSKMALASQNEIIIEQIKIHNNIINWATQKIWGNVDYEKLDKHNVPIKLQIGFHFTTISFKIGLKADSLKQTRYRYKLIGENNNWSILDNNNEAKFIISKSGSFTFVVQELNRGFVIQEKKYRFSKGINSSASLYFDLVGIGITLVVVNALILHTKTPKKKQLH